MAANDTPVRTKPEPTADELAAALRSEAQIAAEAAVIRANAEALTPALWADLRPKLMLPIPGAFIVSISLGKGKPYASTGIGSVEVQRARMDAVLSPFWWWEEPRYLNDAGTLCEVTVFIGHDRERPLWWRRARGGVDRGSTLGNVHKGTYTNAAKLAFARVGPGHEVYVGAADLDPDTDPDAAEQQASDAPGDPLVAPEKRQRVVDAFAAAGVDGLAFGEFLQQVGLRSVEEMRVSHALALRELLDVHTGAAGTLPDDVLAALRKGIEVAGWDDARLQMHLVDLGVRNVRYPADAVAKLSPAVAEQLNQRISDAIDAAEAAR